MKFEDIYYPISDSLNSMEKDQKDVFEKLNTSYLQEIIGYFFKIPGKRLRPALVFLSAGIINANLPEKTNNQLVHFATGIELMHSASLIHDDVIDEDLFRRGQKTLNSVYGKKIAVLAGDVVYSLAFSTLSHSLPKQFEKAIVELTESMCAAEMIQAENKLPNHEIYLNIIKGKTALFMSISCKIAASLAGATKEQINNIEKYGLNLGMAYQIMDDCIDKDIDVELHITSKYAKLYGNKAITSLGSFKDSPYKTSLINLVNFIINSSHS